MLFFLRYSYDILLAPSVLTQDIILAQLIENKGNVAAIRIHHPDPQTTVTVAAKDNLRPVGGPTRIAVVTLLVSQSGLNP